MRIQSVETSLYNIIRTDKLTTFILMASHRAWTGQIAQVCFLSGQAGCSVSPRPTDKLNMFWDLFLSRQASTLHPAIWRGRCRGEERSESDQRVTFFRFFMKFWDSRSQIPIEIEIAIEFSRPTKIDNRLSSCERKHK